uniref:Uncharacterized protein n=1 Tax=Utricularia reniformis TaxID=192314 RepID=A0A1Y0B1K4_9LAMI|nr:hypothetical protein AEK19_MT1054 [Utricularia reniformis]ART31277.1 hypothetical protein AEK19_MT1054 [Utricularia reniformis]
MRLRESAKQLELIWVIGTRDIIALTTQAATRSFNSYNGYTEPDSRKIGLLLFLNLLRTDSKTHSLPGTAGAARTQLHRASSPTPLCCPGTEPTALIASSSLELFPSSSQVHYFFPIVESRPDCFLAFLGY